jgi:ferredoxin
MPKLIVDGVAVEVPAGKRLVNALVDEAKADQLHSCGGHAKCTTCRVEFVAGEPSQMTQAEKDVLSSRGMISSPNLRLSCQILCEAEMSVKVVSRFAGSGKKDPGGRPGDQIEPPPIWTSR